MMSSRIRVTPLACCVWSWLSYSKITEVSTLVAANPGYEYVLQADLIDVVRVEYPTGEDPPVYLDRWDHRHPDFFNQTGYYDVQIDDDTSNGTLWLSFKATYMDYIGILYTAPHDADLDSGDAITVREDHESILILFVIWQAVKERVATHLQDPDTTSDILQKMVNAEMQAEQEYLRAIRNASQRHTRSAYTGPWRADIYDPIY